MTQQFFDLRMHLSLGPVRILLAIIIVKPYPELPLQLLYLQSVILLPHDIPILPPDNVLLDLLIFLVDFL